MESEEGERGSRTADGGGAAADADGLSGMESRKTGGGGGPLTHAPPVLGTRSGGGLPIYSGIGNDDQAQSQQMAFLAMMGSTPNVMASATRISSSPSGDICFANMTFLMDQIFYDDRPKPLGHLSLLWYSSADALSVGPSDLSSLPPQSAHVPVLLFDHRVILVPFFALSPELAEALSHGDVGVIVKLFPCKKTVLGPQMRLVPSCMPWGSCS